MASAGIHGFPPALTSFVGRAAQVDEVAGLLADFRLVTVTGPGGVGKTRLATEVARRVADRFADDVWLAELAAVQEPDLVPASVLTALGLQPNAGTAPLETLAMALARRQLLLVLDNCEHLLEAAADLCGTLLLAADDIRILATSREPLGLSGEARYRLPPLSLPEPETKPGPGGSEAVALFADRARQADPHFTLDRETGALAAQLVAGLDGMPLAIELAAARVEALGMAQLVERLDDRFGLLTGGDRRAAARQRSLAAAVEWSYQLLGTEERKVFRLVSAFPAPFTLEAAEAVAGSGTGAVILHLVDCSMLVPPRTGPDGRARYAMLETLRVYAAERRAEAGEQAAAALAELMLGVAEAAAAQLETGGGELAAGRLLDAEDATMHQALAWALEHDPATALRLAIALAPWWFQRSRLAAGYGLLAEAAGSAVAGSQAWCAAQYWLGLLAAGPGQETSLAHFTAVRDALATAGPSLILARALSARSTCLVNLGHLEEAADDARHSLAMARELGYPAGQVRALALLAAAAHYAGNHDGALAWLRQAEALDLTDVTGRARRALLYGLATGLIGAGQAALAEAPCEQGLDLARQAGDLRDQALFLVVLSGLERDAGRVREGRMHLREAIRLALGFGNDLILIDAIDHCALFCARAQRWADSLTLWAASAAGLKRNGAPELPMESERRREPLAKATAALPPGEGRAAAERGAAMTLAIAAEYAALLLAAEPEQPPAAPDLPRLSGRERELVTLVAQGRTDAQIAAQLFISIRTVRSHLDRIREKSGCRRRADLTRLALQTGLV